MTAVRPRHGSVARSARWSSGTTLRCGVCAGAAGGQVSTDEDHTFTATYDNSNLKLFLDGNEVASVPASGDVDLGEFPLFIGEDNDARGLVNENLIGSLDDAFIISRALSAEEIKAVFELK